MTKGQAAAIAHRMTGEIMQMSAITLNRAMKPNGVIKAGSLEITFTFRPLRNCWMRAHDGISW